MMPKRGLLIVGLVVVVVVIAAINLANRGADPLTNVGDRFMTALKNHDMTTAFSMLTPELRREMGEITFGDIFSEAGVLEWSFHNQLIQDEQGYLSGEATIDNHPYKVELKFRQGDGHWQLMEYTFDR